MKLLNQNSLKLALGAVAIAVAGCGQKTLATKETAPVHGKVTLADGKPLDIGGVWFEPDNIEVGTPCEAKLQKDGTFTANAYPGKEGIAPGEYHLSIVPYDGAKHGKYEGTPPSIPAKYTDPKTADIKVTVASGQDNTIDIQLK